MSTKDSSTEERGWEDWTVFELTLSRQRDPTCVNPEGGLAN
jgi:hypothetical protein